MLKSTDMLTRRTLIAGLALSLLGAADGCSTPVEESASDEAQINASAEAKASLDADAVNAAIAELQRARESVPIGAYYEDGSRIEGCWRNPAGAKLTDLKKAFYCSMPLEFRLCNTIVLLTTEESEVTQRYQGYLDCQKKVDGVFGNDGRFTFSDDVNAMYEKLYLKGDALPPSDAAKVVAANKPVLSGRSFPIVLLAIGKSLTKEAVDLSLDALSSLVSDYKQAARNEPR